MTPKKTKVIVLQGALKLKWILSESLMDTNNNSNKMEYEIVFICVLSLFFTAENTTVVKVGLVVYRSKGGLFSK